jgi:SNF2 family DNA or RNA helicase
MKLRTKPMIIQDQGIAFGLKHKTWGLLSEMGTGKTLTAIYWAAKAGLKRVAVLGRRDDLITWENEIQAHTDAHFVNICAVKSKAKRVERLRLYEEGTLDVFCLMTYDSVKQLKDELKKVKWDGVIADEFTEIKHPNTKRTKAILEVFGATSHRVGMTGTPVTNSPEDLFSQMRFIDGGKRLGTNFWKFRNEWFWPEPNGHRWHLFNDARERLHKLIYETCIRFKKEDALDLPPKVYLKKECELTPAQRKAYSQILDEYELTLKSGEIWEFDYAVQQFIKMLQVTGGFYYDPEKNPIDLPSGKLKTLEWMLDLPEFRQTKKIVIWATFNHELELIRDLASDLGYHGVVFWKHTPDRRAARERFRDDSHCQLFIGQAASGIGMNELKVSDTVFYYSRSLKLIHRLQSEDRTHRKGSEIHERIRYIDLIVPGTVDAKVYTMLRKCRDLADMIVDGKSAQAFIRS